MAISKIIEKYNFSENEAKRLTESILERFPATAALHYSIVWSIFNRLASGKGTERKRERIVIMPRISAPERDYVIVMGSIHENILKKLNDRGMDRRLLRVTNRRIGFVTANRILFPRTYRNIGPAPEIRTGNGDIDADVSNIIANDMHDLEDFRNMLNREFSRKKPMLILMDEDRTKYKRMLAQAGIENGIRTIVIQHGATPSRYNSGVPLSDESFTPLIADIFIAWGNTALNYMVQSGNDEAKIKIGGNPAMKREKNRGGKGILVVDQQFIGQDDERREAYRMLIHDLTESGLDFRIYLRNKYNRGFFRKYFPDVEIIEWERGKLYSEMDRSEYIAGFHSSALIEALFRQKPVLSYDYAGRGDILSITGNAGACVKPGSLKFELDRVKNASDDDFRKETQMHVSYMGNEAAEKIAGILQDVK